MVWHAAAAAALLFERHRAPGVLTSSILVLGQIVLSYVDGEVAAAAVKKQRPSTLPPQPKAAKQPKAKQPNATANKPAAAAQVRAGCLEPWATHPDCRQAGRQSERC
jgi:hypothetical protein